MGHIPHVLIPGPWEGDAVPLPEATERHLRRVLRRDEGSPLSYTDGAGVIGRGRYDAGRVIRGDEGEVAADVPALSLVVAPPRSAERLRFLVEKAAELGVTEIRWLQSRHGEGRVPRGDKSAAWAAGALEQCRGAWLTRVADHDGLVEIEELAAAAEPAGELVLVAHPGGVSLHEALRRTPKVTRVTVVIGPEGGLADDEIPRSLPRVGLGERVLRTETAAIAIAAAIRLA